MNRDATCRVAALALVCGLAALGGCTRSQDEGASEDESKDPKKIAQELNRIGDEDLAEPNHAEAREWFADEAHILFEGDRKAVVQLVEDLYEAGAVDVYVTGIEELGNVKVTASLLAVLPEDPVKRQAVFDQERIFWGGNGSESGIDSPADPDPSQKYVRFVFD
jgi:hypothetical protein